MIKAQRRQGILSVYRDAMAGAVLLVVCLLLFAATTYFPKVPPMLSQNIPPTFFPRVVLAVLAGLSCALLVKGLSTPSKTPESGKLRARVRPIVYVTGAVIGGSVLLLELLGMTVTLILAVTALPLCWREHRAVIIGCLAVGVPLLVYVIFSITLGVRFPDARLLSFFQ